MSDTDRIECKQAMYSVIQYSKFPWLQQAIELNPHKSDIFFWLDAGGSRFFNNFDLTEPYPGTAAMESYILTYFMSNRSCNHTTNCFTSDVS